MKSMQTLPDGYKPFFSLDLKKDKKPAFIVHTTAILISVLMVVPVAFCVPITTLFDMSDGSSACLIRALALTVGMIAYIILHEAVHGIAMKIVGTKKVKYGFTGAYAFAGSDDYYDKSTYLTIALALVVLFFFIFGVLNFFVPVEWFWVVYMLQVVNISGAAGDFYVSFKFFAMPKDILVRDYGVHMNVFSKSE